MSLGVTPGEVEVKAGEILRKRLGKEPRYADVQRYIRTALMKRFYNAADEDLRDTPEGVLLMQVIRQALCDADVTYWPAGGRYISKLEVEARMFLMEGDAELYVTALGVDIEFFRELLRDMLCWADEYGESVAA